MIKILATLIRLSAAAAAAEELFFVVKYLKIKVLLRLHL